MKTAYFDVDKEMAWYVIPDSNTITNRNSYSRRAEANKARSKQVVMLDDDMNIINTYDNAIKAAMDTGIPCDNIRSACNGKTATAGGYKWMYENEFEKLNKEDNA